MVLEKVKIYLDGTMLRLESTDEDFLNRSMPTGSLQVINQGQGFTFEDIRSGELICSVDSFDDVLDAAGATYGATQDDVLTALNAFINFKQGGGGAIFENFYKKSQYHLMTGEGGRISNVFATPANILYLRKIKVLDDVTVTGLVIEVTAGLLGSAVAGVYSIDADGNPDSLLFQTSGQFDLNITGIQEVSLAQNYALSAGTYAVAYHASSAASTRSISRPLPSWGQNKTNLVGENNFITAASAYSSTMPAVFPSATVSVSVTQAAAVLFSLA